MGEVPNKDAMAKKSFKDMLDWNQELQNELKNQASLKKLWESTQWFHTKNIPTETLNILDKLVDISPSKDKQWKNSLDLIAKEWFNWNYNGKNIWNKIQLDWSTKEITPDNSEENKFKIEDYDGSIAYIKITSKKENI